VDWGCGCGSCLGLGWGQWQLAEDLAAGRGDSNGGWASPRSQRRQQEQEHAGVLAARGCCRAVSDWCQ